MRLEFAPYLLHFKEPGGTSRGVMTEKPTFLIKVYDENDPGRYGIGEAAVFPGLSPEADGNYVWKLTELLANVAIGRPTDLTRHSSIQFGFEQALLDFSNGCCGIYFPSPFTEGERSVVINGLVWMGDCDVMMERLDSKIAQGYKCIKLKIGAISWEEERGLIESVRKRYSPENLTIRVDANGGFTPVTAAPVLKQLADLGVHSIEQPIPAGNPEAMARICLESPVPVALDEELIGKGTTDGRRALLDIVKPQYLVLKPALCGGFSGAQEWISLAAERGIGWWATSALESNVGLNAIAQWTGMMDVSLPQGLGTGEVFTDNFETPLYREGEELHYRPGETLGLAQFADLKWHR